jgi:hypothetical protein
LRSASVRLASAAGTGGDALTFLRSAVGGPMGPT